MSRYQQLQLSLLENRKTWLITGVAGFIGSNLLEKLLQLNQEVVGLDKFSTGHKHNIDAVLNSVASETGHPGSGLSKGILENWKFVKHAAKMWMSFYGLITGGK